LPLSDLEFIGNCRLCFLLNAVAGSKDLDLASLFAASPRWSEYGS
jgi:hypothetical protein